MDVTTATPREIDTQLADIYRRAAQARQRVLAAESGLHYALNERKVYANRRQSWPTTTDQALEAVRAKVADPDYKEVPWGTSPAKSLARYDEAVTQLAAVEAEATPLNAEFARRGGWSRFFTVKQHNGHIHSTMNCSTCNRGHYATEFGWNPELSGLTMAEAIAHFDRAAHVLCTVCFPDAPVEWTVREEATGKCVGKYPVNGSISRTGMRHYGTCLDCKSRELVNQASGKLRAHKTKTAEK